MTAIELLRFQFHFAHNWLDGTLKGVDGEVAHWHPGDKVHSIAAQYVHILTTEDFVVSKVLTGDTPLMASSYAGKTGFNEMPPQGNRDEWANHLRVDLDLLLAYGKAVYAASDAYLLSITDADLDRTLDVSNLGFGTQSVAFILNLLILNAYVHSGEISFAKGLQGLQGYPA